MDLIKKHPHYHLAQRIAKSLQSQGHLVYLAGGCVRDALLGKMAKDLDLATSARPEQIEQLFPKTVSVGKSFGVICVIEEGFSFEVATFRQDGEYSDGRHPEKVIYSDPKTDAERRDFTMNALFYDLKTGQIIDYVQGERDLHNQIIRAVGEPSRRFEEDQLRMLRAVRFVSQLGFQIEEKTWKAICDCHQKILTVSRERVTEELVKLMAGAGKNAGFKLLVESQILKALFPSIQWNDSKYFSKMKVQTDDENWVLFFIWAHLCGGSHQALKELFSGLRLSRATKEGVLRAISWFVDPLQLQNSRLGALVEESYDTMTYFGLCCFIEIHNHHRHSKWLQIQERRIKIGPMKPDPLIHASDLLSQYQGARLGKILKALYWAQLEGKIQSKDQGFEQIKSIDSELD